MAVFFLSAYNLFVPNACVKKTTDERKLILNKNTYKNDY